MRESQVVTLVVRGRQDLNRRPLALKAAAGMLSEWVRLALCCVIVHAFGPRLSEFGPTFDPTSWSLAGQERVSLLTVPFRDWETQYVSQTARHSSGVSCAAARLKSSSTKVP